MMFGKHTHVCVYGILRRPGYVQIWYISSISYPQLQSVSLPTGISLFHKVMKSVSASSGGVEYMQH